MDKSAYSQACIIGAFQTPELHEGHMELFDYVLSNHEIVNVYVCLAPIVDDKNFLDFNQRKCMILEKYPNVNIFYIKDTKEDLEWSNTLDGMISDVLRPTQKPLLYGSKESFIDKYTAAGGRFDTEEFVPTTLVSSQMVREKLSRSMISNKYVRIGMYLASLMRYPTAYTTVDIAIMDDNRKSIWLGQKKGETQWRFIGGFSDPRSYTLEDDAIRETMEETHIELSYPEYVFSTLINDWRYRFSRDKIKTTFWIGDRVGGDPRPDDDIVAIRKFPIDTFIWPVGESPMDTTILRNKELIVGGHRELMRRLIEELLK